MWNEDVCNVRFVFNLVAVVTLATPALQLNGGKETSLSPVCPNNVGVGLVGFGLYGDGLMKMGRKASRVMLGKTSFMMGSEPPIAIPGDGETPLRRVYITKPFFLDETEVTVQSFLEFVKETNYSTTAEHYGNSFSFWMEDGRDVEEIKRLSQGRVWWWVSKERVNWRNAGNNLQEKHLKRRTLPVNHVSWDDALQFCRWAGGRLPTEEEWEYACRGGLNNSKYSWGDQLKINGSHMANIWQGKFPAKNTKKDGFSLRAPVASFPCNAYGLYDMAGNVWEWVDGDWASNSPEHYSPDVRIQKGGSFLCHRNHCYRYRCSARTKASRDSTASNVGFRCAYDLPQI